MKLLTLLAGLGLSSAVKAQVLAPEATLPPNPDTVRPVAKEAALQGAANLHYMVLKERTPIYLQAADTATERYVRKLRRGTEVYIEKYLPQGIMIKFAAGHNKEYYLPGRFVKGLSTYIGI